MQTCTSKIIAHAVTKQIYFKKSFTQIKTSILQVNLANLGGLLYELTLRVNLLAVWGTIYLFAIRADQNKANTVEKDRQKTGDKYIIHT